MAAVGPALLCAWLLPGALLAMEAIHDEDLDRVNAAGLCRPQGAVCETAAADPSVAAENNTVAQETGSGPPGSSSSNVTITNAQQAINAMAVNNVSGLNQVANGINISGSVGLHR